MPSTVEDLGNNRVKLTIEIPFEDMKPSMDKAYREIAQQVTIPGFRKGKVPPAVIDQRFGKATVIQEALNDVMPGAYAAALQETETVPLGEPDIQVTDMEMDQKIVFTAELDRRPDFEVPSAADIAVEVAPAESVDDQVDEQIELLRSRFATQNEVERPAQAGDVVTVNLLGTRDGIELEGAKVEGATLEVGTEGNMPGLDDAVIGLSAGESATFISTLMGGASAGEEADVEVTLVKVAERVLPDFDDDFAQLASPFDTAEEMKSDLRENAEQMSKLSQAASARDKVLEVLVEKAEIELPEKVVADELAERKQSIEMQLAQSGMSLKQYLEQVEDGRSEDDFWAELEKNNIVSIKAQLLLDKAAEESDVEISEADFQEHLMRRAQQNGTSPEQEIQHMMEHNHMNEWAAEIRRSKALSALVAEAKATDTDGNAVDLSVLNPPKAEAEDAAEAE